jgi:hypothetical protein
LNDLNLMQSTIPSPLLNAQAGAYALPADLSCEHLGQLVIELNHVLRPDLDAAAAPGKKLLSTDPVEDASTSFLRRTVEGAVPFRGWLRMLSGADKASAAAASALHAGNVRRAYLKGLAQALHCPPPAGPHLAPVEAPAKEAPK